MLASIPFRPLSRPERHEVSAPGPSSPQDSGYGSASPWPSSSENITKETGPLLVGIQKQYDGNQSDSDDALAGSDLENSLADVAAALLSSPPVPQSRPRIHRRSASLPQQKSRSRPVLPPPFRSAPDARFRQGRFNTTPIRHLDRFIPARHWVADTRERLKLNKPPHELTTCERLIRHSGATEDAFVYRRRVKTPLGAESRLRARAEMAASRNEGQ